MACYKTLEDLKAAIVDGTATTDSISAMECKLTAIQSQAAWYAWFTNGSSGSTTVYSTLPETQPLYSGLWVDDNVLTFWDGTSNNVIDFNEGQNVSLFNTPIQGDI